MQGKIGIFGDSWGCGEWNYDFKNYMILHQGLEQYAKDDGYYVKNYSCPCSSNMESRHDIEQDHYKFDTIIWIISEPSRDYQNFNDFYKQPKTVFREIKDDDFLEQCKIAHRENIEKVNELCGEKIILVGGLHKVDITMNTKFKLITNWLDLLGGYHLEPYYTNYSSHKDQNIIVNHLEKQKLKNVFNFLIKNRNMFYPDGVHPNRLAHKILYEKIKVHF